MSLKSGFIPSLFRRGGSFGPKASLNLNFLGGSLGSQVTFSRGTQAMQYGSDGTLQYAPNNLLTYSNQADNAAWTKSNSFVQTNLLLYSQDFDNVAWGKSLITVTANVATAPDGTLTADRIISAGGAYPQTSQNPTLAAGDYTFSLWVKGDGTPQIAQSLLLDGTPVNFTPTDTWTRVSVTKTGVLAGSRGIVIATNSATAPASSFYVWGAQLVQGSVPGDYVATTSAALPVLYADYNGALRARKLCETAITGTHNITQNATVVGGAIYTDSIYVKAGERTSCRVINYDNGANYAWIYVDLTNGNTLNSGVTGTVSSQSFTVTSAGLGWYRISVVAGIAATTRQFRIDTAVGASENTTGDGSSGIYIADAQLTPGYLPLAVTETTSAAVYGPRFDYDPVTKVARGLLIEEQRVNLLLQSNTFNVTWTASTNTNVTAAAGTSPEGVVNAWRLYGSNGLVPGGLFQAISKAAAATQYTWSIYAKPAGYNWLQLAVFDGTADGNRYWFNLSTGVLGSTAVIGAGFTGVSATITNIGNGWYRCTLTATSNTAVQYNGYAYPTNGDGVTTAGNAFTDGTFIYGAQLEAGAFATSYIPTVASTATRNADSASVTTLTPWFNAAAGTLYVQGLHTNIPSSAAMALEIGDGTVNNRHAVFTAGTANCNYYDVVGGVNQATISASTFAANVVGKFSAAYALNDFQVAGNGTLGGSDISGSLPAGLTTMFIGNSIGSTSFWNGWLNSIRYYPTRLPNASLQSITV